MQNEEVIQSSPELSEKLEEAGLPITEPTVEQEQVSPLVEEQSPERDSAKEPQLQKSTETQAYTLQQNVCLENNDVALVGFFGRKAYVPGRLKISNLRMLFYVIDKNQQEQTLLDIPIGGLAKVERSVEDKLSYVLEIFVKYGASFRVKYGEGELSSRCQKIISHLIDNSYHLAYQYGAKTAVELKCQLFCPTHCQEVQEAYWYDNQGWKKMPNYPQKFRVPMPYLSKSNTEQRLVVLSCVYNNGKDQVALWRTGPGKMDPSEDDWMGKAKAMKKIVTIEIKNKGIGTTRSLATRFFDLQNLQGLKETFSNMYKLAANSHDSLKWIGQMLSTKWYDQVTILLQEASVLVNQMISSSMHVTVLADTEVRGAQLVALAQILLFPQCRTIQGFGELIERQFLQWGGHRQLLKKDNQPDRGPAFIQFLDAVFQLTNIYPLSFEFRQSLLVFLAEQVYSNHFGNFLILSKTIKQQERQSFLKCPCIWKTLNSWLQNPQLSSYYLNPFYVDYRECDIYQLKTSPSMKQIRVWGGFFFKKFRESNIDYKIYLRYNELFLEQHRNKVEVEEMKKQLLMGHKIIQERRAVLEGLKSA